MKTKVLLIDCVDEKGLVAQIASELFQRGLNIVSNREFVDSVANRFYMRTEYQGPTDDDDLLEKVIQIVPKDATVRLAKPQKKKLIILATKEPHCLGDLLIRCEYKTLNATIEAVIANHTKLGPLVEKFNVPFHHVSHENRNREQHAQDIKQVVQKYSPDYLVLAKYMRILPPEFITQYKNRIINIHHSFLPAFVGANPYKQAFERGVKVIGATAHFVTDQLDEGPIIGQDVTRVNHRYTAHKMAKAGKDIEKIVLSKAVEQVVDDRVFISGNKTVLFS